MKEALPIIFGFVLLFAINYAVTGLFVEFFYFIVKEKKTFKEKTILTALLSIVNVFLQLFSLVFLSGFGNVYTYCALVFTLSFAGYAAVLYYKFKFSLMDIFIYGVALSLLLNPVWFNLFGII